ncbi:outer membrane lipoprotein carrier protein [Lebetimonas natsushimae]|uniref:Outer membrane lipoprotein carrier protein n=1 Tax=Lebetimonas natsushimae TaxID=1936991 RepID=A0A292YHX1_9BACT|nr:LolA-like outer membrane lipoprotein chaperone [Lebetimonas natsushimae]GAX88275.1 outer membrane lipoprotein carrier protein [Lebetimonas natsushimae]
MKNRKWIIILLLISNLFALNLPKNFTAEFTQYIYQSSKKLTYRGIVIINNNQVYWKYTYPNIKEIWIKDKVYVYEPDLMQVTISKKPKLNLFKILKNAKKLNNNLYVATADNKEIYFIYDKTLKKAYYTDDIGNRVEIYFKKLNKNLKIPPLNFPKNIDFIYQN